MMERKKFFKSIGMGMIGVALFKFFPFANKSEKRKTEKEIKVKLNPLAVRRQKIGRKNV